MDALHEVVEYLQMNQIYVGIFCAIVGVGVAGYAYVSRRRSKDKDENEDINNNAGNNSQFTISEVSVGSISPCKVCISIIICSVAQLNVSISFVVAL